MNNLEKIREHTRAIEAHREAIEALVEEEMKDRAPLITPVPPVILRSRWGAKPPTKPLVPMQMNTIAVHHTAGRRTGNTEDGIKEMQAIQRHHFGNGWADVAYHLCIDTAGNIYEGRQWNPIGATLKDKPMFNIGSHVGGANTGKIGVVLFGNFEVDDPSTDQITSLVQLCRALCRLYLISPEKILPHDTWTATKCPGSRLKALLPSVREQIDTQV